jgi:stearoyl-CoA desaturase (Delta-9 desaturase)
MTQTSPASAPRKDWVNIAFLTLTPILAVPVLVLYTIFVSGFALWMPVLFLVLYAMVGLSVCAGYHRYFSHKSYECSPLVQMFYAVFGAMSAQNSILRWSSGHRRHHSYSESEWDPYSIKRGFWWAHFFWIFYVDLAAENTDNVDDLKKNPIVRWQDSWYRSLVIVAGFGIPTLIGALFGDAIAGLLWGGFLRIVVVHHSTFMVNSLAHHLGSPTYDNEATARDNWAVALLTFGEGYHSFHHRFPADFRNGIRWYAWDPAKWFINSLRLIGLASDLRMTAAPLIERERMKAAVIRLETQIAQAEPSRMTEIRARIEAARVAFDNAMTLWRKQTEERKQGLSKLYRETYRNYRLRLKEARREWRGVLDAITEMGKVPTR